MLEAQALPRASGNCQEGKCQGNYTTPQETDFDVARTFSLLMVTLVLPMYLAISVVAYSLAAIY